MPRSSNSRDPELDLPHGPLARYRAWRRQGQLLHDPAQALAAEKLQALARALADYHPSSGEGGWRARLGLGPAPG
ncbi:MAG: hypothetical protein ACREFQ_10510, partial [Stellaceae bacterium]